jgi:pentatricopeptide repeat protein
MINAYAQSGDSASAVRQFEAMVAKGLEPNVITCNSVINAYAQSGDSASAVRQFEAMVANGLEPNVITCNSVIREYLSCSS